MRRALSFSLLPLWLSACAIMPDTHTPPGVPGHYGELANPGASLPNEQTADLSEWWRQFNDPELQSLIGRALSSNLTLKIAASRIRESRTQEIIAGAPGLPQVNATGVAARVHSNANLAQMLSGGGNPSSTGGSPAKKSSGGTDISLYSAGFDATWEIDVFGGVANNVRAAQANTEAAVWQQRDSEVSLTAELANDYGMLRADQSRKADLNDEIAQQQGVLDLTGARAHAGFVTELDVNAIRAQLAQTQSELPGVDADIRAMEHAIALLLGQPPEALVSELDATGPQPAIPSAVPVGLPSDLLRRRPDIRMAEYKLSAASAQHASAIADLYPKFDLLAGASFASNKLASLPSSSSFNDFGVGAILWPVFHGGEIRANINAKNEEENQAYLSYQAAVLGALRDVEDALRRYAASQQTTATLVQAVAAAQSSTSIAEAQYKSGLATYLNVLNARASLLSAQDKLIQSRQAAMQNLIAVYKALGGGWQEAPDDKKEEARDIFNLPPGP